MAENSLIHMSQRPFFLLISAWLIAGGAAFWYQRTALRHAQAALADRSNSVRNAQSSRGGDPPAAASASPSAELLRLRGELGVARRELDDHLQAEAARAYTNDWQMVYSGPKPSELPGFVTFKDLVPHQFETPDKALQSWHYAFDNQHTEPLDSTRMKEIWDVPDDFDQEPGYNLNMGEGIYGGTGFRVAARETLATNVVRLIIDYERQDGSSYQRERILVQRNGRWRVQPESVTRQER